MIIFLIRQNDYTISRIKVHLYGLIWFARVATRISSRLLKTGTPLYHPSSCCTCSYLTAACSDNPGELSRVPTSPLLEILSKLLVPASISLYPREPSSSQPSSKITIFPIVVSETKFPRTSIRKINHNALVISFRNYIKSLFRVSSLGDN